jgi:putative transposase
MNPIRAKLVTHPDHYPWSSYRFNVEGITNALITPHDEYLRLGASWAERRSAYEQLIHEVLDPNQLDEIRTATNGSFALGGKAFRQRRLGQAC